jgi:hypothetical protein
MQALLKRGLPRALMSDNGSAMTSAEFTSGLQNLGIQHETTMEYAPWQNGKQEFFWSKVEGRLLAMLESVKNLDLKALNDATLAWIEREYNHESNRETGQTPYERFRHSKDVLRPAPGTEQIQHAFMMEVHRQQRRSDGSFTLDGRRFEVPGRYNALDQLTIAYARWDLSTIFLIDQKTRKFICRLYPQDKTKNADGFRRTRPTAELVHTSDQSPPTSAVAPLLQKYMEDYAATGLPPAYIAKQEPADEKR